MKNQAPTTALLMSHVAHKIPSMWYEVGIQLSITTPTLDAFEEQTNKQSRLYIKVFEQCMEERGKSAVHMGYHYQGS